MILLLIISPGLYTCIDPYNPNLQSYESLLVVDALVTDEFVSNTVRLSRTFQNQSEEPEMVSGAEVHIIDDAGNIAEFFEASPGIYLSPDFIGEIGTTYVLHIITPDGHEYESDPSHMSQVPEIDSIYFAYDTDFNNTGNVELEGIRLFVDSDPDNDYCTYFRWTFEECWKFRIPNPALYVYFNENLILPAPFINSVCWHHNNSTEVLIESTETQQTEQIRRKPIFFIASGESNRLQIQYSINVKQYSLSRADYEFWDNMKQIREEGGDIFERQPFSVIGNVHCISDPNQKVLGYFQVSAVKQKRQYITREELKNIDIPSYHYPCSRVVIGPDDFEDPESPFPVPLPTFDELYEMYTSKGFVFIEPVYDNTLEKLVFTEPICSDCALAGGDVIKPDWWIDLD